MLPERIKLLWESSTRVEKLCLGTLILLVVLDLLSGAIFQALLGSLVTVVILYLLNEDASLVETMVEEAFDRTGGLLDDVIE